MIYNNHRNNFGNYFTKIFKTVKSAYSALFAKVMLNKFRNQIELMSIISVEQHFKNDSSIMIFTHTVSKLLQFTLLSHIIIPSQSGSFLLLEFILMHSTFRILSLLSLSEEKQIPFIVATHA